MEQIILFIFSFLFMIVVYQLFFIKGAKKNHNNKDYKEIMEIRYLVYRYKLDLKKVNYNQLLQIVAITSSFDVSIVVSLAMLTNNFILELLVILIGVISLILLSYHIVYLFYKKKGMIKR